MARIIHTKSPAAQRKQLLKAIASAQTRAKARDLEPHEQLDIIAYLHSLLSQIGKAVEATTSAWEKRDYWLKADRFRREWAWVGRVMGELDAALGEGQQAIGRVDLARLMEPILVKVGRRSAMGDEDRPWEGAYAEWLGDRNGRQGLRRK